MLLIVLSACADPEEVVPFDRAQLDAEMQDYDQWEQLPDWTGVKPSCDGFHGAYVQVWLNAVAMADVQAGASTYSEGAIWVKEGYQDAGVISKGVDAMRKVSGYDPDAGDWFWGHYDDEARPVASGHVTGCVPCHAEGTDHVRVLEAPVVDTAAACP